MRFVRKIPHCRLRAYHDTTLWIHLNSCQCQLNGLNPALSIMQDANADMDEDTAGASPRSPPDADGAASDGDAAADSAEGDSRAPKRAGSARPRAAGTAAPAPAPANHTQRRRSSSFPSQVRPASQGAGADPGHPARNSVSESARRAAMCPVGSPRRPGPGSEARRRSILGAVVSEPAPGPRGKRAGPRGRRQLEGVRASRRAGAAA